MNLKGQAKRASILVEGMIALIIISSFMINILNAWHVWDQQIKSNQIELRLERKKLNEIRKKL